MDYRALGEFVFMALTGLSVLAIVTALSFHFVLRPFLETVLVGRRDRGEIEAETGRRLERLEGRVVELEGEVDRLHAAQDFDRKLGRGA